MRLKRTSAGSTIAFLTGVAALAMPLVVMPTVATAQTPAQAPVIQPLPAQAPAATTAAPAPVFQPLPLVAAPAAQAPAVAAPAVAAPASFAAPPPMTPIMAPATVEAEPEVAAENSGLKLKAFVDAYYGIQTQRRGSASPLHRAYAFSAPAADEQGGAYLAAENGFSLSFAGIDAVYEAGPVSATISLRAGTSVPIYYGGGSQGLGIDNLTQAYASWTPIPQLTLDAGQFGTIFGAEVAESWENLNYTRGALYYAMQPFWHTGVRATLSPSDQVSVTAMAVNGVDTITDDNNSPSVALQLALTPNETFSMAVGWFNTPARKTDQGKFDNFFDLVAAVSLDRLTLVLNADLTVNQSVRRETPEYVQTVDSPMFWGVSLAAGFQATETFGLALRGEFLSDADNQLYQVESTAVVPATGREISYPATTPSNLATVTGTLDFKPIRGSDRLVIRWDNRFEFSNREIFLGRTKTPDPTKKWFGSTLGIVVTTGD